MAIGPISKKIRNQFFDYAILGGCTTSVTLALLLTRAGNKVAILESTNIGIETTGSYFTTVEDRDKDISVNDFLTSQPVSVEYLNILRGKTNDQVQRIINSLNIDCGYRAVKSYNGKDTLSEGAESFIINSFKYVTALAHQCGLEGCSILENRRVLKIENAKDGHVVVTSRGKIYAAKIIYTPHSSRLLWLFPKKILPYQSYAILAQLDNGFHTKELAFTSRAISYIVSQTDKNTLIEIKGADHKVIRGKNDEAQFSILQKYLDDNFRVKNMLVRWSSVYYLSKVNSVLTGRLSENTFAVGGFDFKDISTGTFAAFALAGQVIDSNNKQYLIDL